MLIKDIVVGEITISCILGNFFDLTSENTSLKCWIMDLVQMAF